MVRSDSGPRKEVVVAAPAVEDVTVAVVTLVGADEVADVAEGNIKSIITKIIRIENLNGIPSRKSRRKKRRPRLQKRLLLRLPRLLQLRLPQLHRWWPRNCQRKRKSPTSSPC